MKLRLARPSDALRVRAFLERHRPALAESAKRFTFYDPRERLVLVATAPIDGVEKVVGLVDAGDGPPVAVGEATEVVKLLTAAGVSLSARGHNAA